jgi:hypothetical protein
MRRILLLFSAVVMMGVVFAGPALAQGFDFFSTPHFFNVNGHDDDDDGFFTSFGDGDDGLEFADQELESGDIENETNIAIDGSNNNQCVGLSQFGNTGNFANQQGFTSGDGGSGFDDDDGNHDDDDFFGFGFDGNGEFDGEFDGGELTFAPENETTCEQAVQQASAASSW